MTFVETHPSIVGIFIGADLERNARLHSTVMLCKWRKTVIKSPDIFATVSPVFCPCHREGNKLLNRCKIIRSWWRYGWYRTKHAFITTNKPEFEKRSTSTYYGKEFGSWLINPHPRFELHSGIAGHDWMPPYSLVIRGGVFNHILHTTCNHLTLSYAIALICRGSLWSAAFWFCSLSWDIKLCMVAPYAILNEADIDPPNSSFPIQRPRFLY